MKSKLSFFVLCMSLSFAPSAAAQVPTSMPIEGYLTDASDDPIDGLTEATFTIYDDPEAGSSLWTETVDLSVVNGRFIKYLGSETPVDASIFTGGGTRYLAVTIDGEELSPRFELASVPYAHVAEIAGVAETLEGFAADDFVRSDDQQWSNLQGIPSALLDLAALSCSGDQFAAYDGANWVCSTISDTLSNLSCAAGESISWNGSAWVCSAPNGLATVATSGDFNDLVNTPTGLSDGDDDTLAGLICAPGEVVAWSGTQWSCVTPPAEYTDSDAVAAMGAKSDMNPLHHDRAQYSAGAGLQLSGNTFEARPRGTVYTRWGRADCPTGAQLVYSGYAVSGGNFDGGISSLHCFHDTPTWPADVDTAYQNGAFLLNIEFRTLDRNVTAFNQHSTDDAVCAVCLQQDADLQLMIPGTLSCPTGWNEEYSGYLMGPPHNGVSEHDAACVDVNATPDLGTGSTGTNSSWFYTEFRCPGGLGLCSAADETLEVGCAVCTR